MNSKLILILLVNLAVVIHSGYGNTIVNPFDNTEVCSEETQTSCDDHALISNLQLHEADLSPYCTDMDYRDCHHLDMTIHFSIDEPDVDALIAYFSMCVSEDYKNIDKHRMDIQGPFEIGQNYTRVFSIPLTKSEDHEASNTSSTILKMTFEDLKTGVSRQTEEKIVDKCYVAAMYTNQNDPGTPDGPFLSAFKKLFHQ